MKLHSATAPHLPRRGSLERRRSLYWLGAIVASACVIASIWLVRVPIYQEPDELAHVDYIFAIFDVGHPFRIAYKNPHVEVAPQTRYLTSALGYRKMRYNPYARVPLGYGTAPYFRRLDDGVPAPSGQVPKAGAAIPYVMYLYPPGYYLFEAALLTAIYKFYGSFSAGFFAMRALNVALLAGTLVLSYFSFRAYGSGRRLSLLAVFAIGAFPLTSIVSSYVQPDNATTFLVAVVVFAIARGRHDRSCASDALAMTAVALLFLVKQHYAAAAWLATAPILALRTNMRPPQVALRIALVVLPLVAFALSNRYLNPVSGLESPLAFISRTRSTLPTSSFSIGEVLRLTLDAVTQSIDGTVFRGFWFSFGFRGGHIFFKDVLAPCLGALTIGGTIAFAIAQWEIWKRIRIASSRTNLRTAIRLFFAGHPSNLYVMTTVTLIFAHVATGGVLELEGRYWFPMLLPLAIITLRAVPRPLAPRVRRTVAFGFAVMMAAYSLFASPVAIRAMNDDFYGRLTLHQHEPVADILAMRARGGSLVNPHLLRVGTPQTAHISGYAIDMLTGLPAKNVYVEIDRGARVEASIVGLPFAPVAQTFNDDRVADTRFSIDVPPELLALGRHDLRFFVGKPSKGDGIPFRDTASIITGAGTH